MRPFAGLLAALAVALPVSACAASGPPKAVLDAVAPDYAEIMAGMYDETDPDSPRPGPPPRKMFSPVDINGDGVKDWRVDFEHAQNPSFFCGTGGCQQKLFVSRPDGSYALVFASNMREMTFGKLRGEQIIDLDFHGSTCGGAGSEECPRRYAWDETAGRYVERINKMGSGWLSGGTRVLVDLPTTVFPDAVKAQRQRRVALCKTAGGTYKLDELLPFDLPDLNGDGVRDWVVGASYDYCDMGETGRDSPAMPVTILVSQPDGGFIVGWEQVDPDWGIELGAPNRLATLVGENCHFGDKPCAKSFWRWTGTRFEQP